MNKQTLIIIAGLFMAVICILGLGALFGAGFIVYRYQTDAPQQVTLNQPTPTASQPTPIPPPAEPTPTQSTPQGSIKPALIPDNNLTETEALLTETDLPVRDLRALASRLRNQGAELPEVVYDTPPVYQLGDQDAFWIVDNTQQPPVQFQATATLQHITEHTYWWVEDGFSVNQQDLARSADVFENRIYPTNRNFFGSEWSPGVDNDVHISIYLGNVPGVAGYYASSHEFSQQVDQYSNQREMFLINLNALKPGDPIFESVLAHEFQHMIHWHQDRNEETWVNEGLSELAVLLNDYGLDRAQHTYLQNPDLQLTTWAQGLANTAPHYGSSYLFMAYFLDRFGEETMKRVVSEQANGVQGFDVALKAAGYQTTFDEVFADFLVANYLDDPTLAAGQWGYSNLDIEQAHTTERHNRFPTDRADTVHQYGADYIALNSDQPLTFNFAGAATVPVLNNQPHSGRYQWYSNRGDDSNATLTRAIDLREVTQATLTYWAWYDIEADWDYAYVEISNDGGISWTILPGAYSSTNNPTGNAYGPGYTGISGGWVEERIDLTEFSGQEVLLRFEYITDDATNGPGFALDDVAIPEIGLFDDMESPDPAWQAEGFIRMDNILPQQFTVQIIDLTSAQPTVTQLPLDEANSGQMILGTAEAGVDAILVISAQAPVTTEVTEYRYSIVPVGE